MTDGASAAAPFGRRARLVAAAVGAGFVAGSVGFAGGLLVFSTSPREASTLVFLLGTLAFGFGILGWSGSILAGEGFANMQRYMDSPTDWTERKSRRAMARVGGFGAGAMAAAVLIGTALGV